MITDATLYLATAADASSALLRVAGRPVAFRAVHAAVRAGCRRVAVPASFRGTEVERAIAGSPTDLAATVWLDGETAPPRGPSLLVPAAALVTLADLRRLARGEPATVLPPHASAPVVAADADLTRALWTDIHQERPLAPSLQPLLEGRAARRAAADWYVHVTSVREAREAESLLYRGLGSPVDTPLDTAFHRRLSRPITRLAIALGITANQVSVLSLLVGFTAVWCFWGATPTSAALGLLLYALSVVLDHCDGEVARLTLTESRLGEWLDMASDTVIHALVVLAMGMTAGSVGLAVLAAVGVVVSAVLAKTSPRSAGGVGGVLDAVGSRDGFYGMLVAYVLALTVFPAGLPLLMIVVTAGSHAYWLTRLGHRAFSR